MQTNNNNNNATISVSCSQPTIIQVAKTNSTALLQNGQHLLIGKIEQSTNNSAVDNQSGNSSSNTMQAIYPLQYIETAVANNNNQNNNDGNSSNAYGTASNKIFYQDSHSSSIYTSMSGTTAAIIPASSIQARDLSNQLAANVGPTVHIQGAQHAQIVHHGGNAYLVQSTGRLEDESPNLSHATKSNPVTMQWLYDNYETADGVSLPRSTLYNHYLQHCQQEKLEPMNQASFGKLIRSVFFGLRTRRLGTRGNSKYHYYGIRIKPNSVLNHYVEDQTFAMRQYPSFHRQSNDNDFHWRGKYNNNGLNYGGASGVGSGGGGVGTGINNSSVITSTSSSNPTSGGTASVNNSSILIMNNTTGSSGIADCSNNQHSNYLGESSSALPNLSDIIARAELDTLIEEDCHNEGVTLDDINIFCQMYLDHSDAVLSAVVYLNFKYIETLWQEFWRTSTKPTANHFEEKLSKVQLHRLLKIPQIQSFLQLFDNMFYQSLVEVLIPNVLRPIPSALTQNIRHFAKSLESWMAAAICGLNQEVVQIKMSCVCALAQTLRRHTSLNHLAQAARAVLKNASQISQMLTDLNRVDFTNVQEQASWVCGCDNKRVDALQQEFKRILQQQASLEEWATWLDHVVSDVLEPYKGTPQYSNAAHQFILKWSFYSSMVIRDLTLRSAASFGSFHLIRLLYDEYIYYLVEQKVAEHLNLSPVAVTGEMGRQLMAADCANYGHMSLQVEIDETARTENNATKQLKFKAEQGIKKEGTDVLSGGGNIKLPGDYGGLISYNASTPNQSRITNLPSSIDMDYHRVSGTNSVAAGDSNQSGYNNSSALTDDQVDESADDDEGLDEDFQTSEPIPLSQLQDTKSLSTQSVTLATSQKKAESAQSGSLINSAAIAINAISNVISGSGGNQLATVNRTSTIGPSSSSSSSVRKTVNVTTFGEPLQSSTATTLTSSTGGGGGGDVPITSINKPSTTGTVSMPTQLTISSTTSLKTSPITPSNSNSNPNPNPKVTAPVSDSPPTATVVAASMSSSSSSLSSSSNISVSLSTTALGNKRIKLVNNCSIASSNSVTGSSSM